MVTFSPPPPPSARASSSHPAPQLLQRAKPAVFSGCFDDNWWDSGVRAIVLDVYTQTCTPTRGYTRTPEQHCFPRSTTLSNRFLPTPRSLRNGNIPPRNLIPPPAFLPRAMIYNDIEPAQQHIECTVTRVISSPDTRAVKYRPRLLPSLSLESTRLRSDSPPNVCNFSPNSFSSFLLGPLAASCFRNRRFYFLISLEEGLH